MRSPTMRAGATITTTVLVYENKSFRWKVTIFVNEGVKWKVGSKRGF